MTMTFDQFPVEAQILTNIKNMGFTEPTQIQKDVLEAALQGKDVSGLSRTGTGKTAAFLIPTLHRLLNLPPEGLALVLAPTRELAIQIQQEADRLAKDTGVQTVCVVGGMSSEDQIRALQRGARLIIGTPGRVIDLFKERALHLGNIQVLVFDEADRMFDMGFIRDMQYILGKVNPKRQILLFSATMNFSVLNMTFEFGADPVEINVSRDQMTAEKIKQVLYHVGDNEKPASLLAICKKHSPDAGTIIVFVNYKERVPWVAALLSKNGIPAQGLSSLLRQEKRNRIIKDFKAGKFRALVATDVASRGLDVDDISIVVNYHLPEEAATYVHRIGRTARAGRNGIAISICSSEDAYNQMRVEEFLGHKIDVEWLSEDEVPKNVVMPNYRDTRDEDEEEPSNSAEGQEGMPNNNRRDHGRDSRGGHRNDRGPRGPRGDRPDRPRREHRGPPPAEQGAAPAADRPLDDAAGPAVAAAPRHPREQHSQGRDRNDRGPRHPRNDRGPRGDRPDSRYDRNNRRDRNDRGPRPHHGRGEPEKLAANLPSPVTGNPVIYCMKTGKPKNRTEQEFSAIESEYNSKQTKTRSLKKGAILNKIRSKVSSLFGPKTK